MNKEPNKKESLGFIYGYKETQSNTDKTFTVHFLHGVSKKYPKKFEKKKDFYAEEIFVGDNFELFINKNDLLEVFSKELNSLLQENSYYNELYDQRKSHYINPPTKEQYFALTSFDYSMLNFIGKSFESEKDFGNALQDSVGQFFNKKTDTELLTLYEEHKSVSKHIYENELDLFFNDSPKINKPKP